jgi:hypothetical protein
MGSPTAPLSPLASALVEREGVRAAGLATLPEHRKDHEAERHQD